MRPARRPVSRGGGPCAGGCLAQDVTVRSSSVATWPVDSADHGSLGWRGYGWTWLLRAGFSGLGRSTGAGGIEAGTQ